MIPRRSRCLFAVSLHELVLATGGRRLRLSPSLFDDAANAPTEEPITPAKMSYESVECLFVRALAWLGHTHSQASEHPPRGPSVRLRHPHSSWRVLAVYLLERHGFCSNLSGNALRFLLACGDDTCFRDVKFLYDLVRCAVVRVVSGCPSSWYRIGDCSFGSSDDSFFINAPGLKFATEQLANREVAGMSPFLRLRSVATSGWHDVMSLASMTRIVDNGLASAIAETETRKSFALLRLCHDALTDMYGGADAPPATDIHICAPVARLLMAVSPDFFRRNVDKFCSSSGAKAATLFGRTVLLMVDGGPSFAQGSPSFISALIGSDLVTMPTLSFRGQDCAADDRDYRREETGHHAGLRNSPSRSLHVLSVTTVDLSNLMSHPMSGFAFGYTAAHASPTGAMFNAVQDVIRMVSSPGQLIQPNSHGTTPAPLCSATISGCMLVVRHYGGSVPIPYGVEAEEVLHVHPSHVGALQLIGTTIQKLICSMPHCFSAASSNILEVGGPRKGRPVCRNCGSGGQLRSLSDGIASLRALGAHTTISSGLTYDLFRDHEVNVMPSGVSSSVAWWFRARTFYARVHLSQEHARARELKWREDGKLLLQTDPQGMYYLACACLISRCCVVTEGRVTIYPPTDRMGVLDPPAVGTAFATPGDLFSGSDADLPFSVIDNSSTVSYQLVRFAASRTLDIIVSYVPRDRYGSLSHHALSRSGITLPTSSYGITSDIPT